MIFVIRVTKLKDFSLTQNPKLETKYCNLHLLYFSFTAEFPESPIAIRGNGTIVNL